MEGLTDMCDMTRIQRCQPGKQGDCARADIERKAAALHAAAR